MTILYWTPGYLQVARLLGLVTAASVSTTFYNAPLHPFYSLRRQRSWKDLVEWFVNDQYTAAAMLPKQNMTQGELKETNVIRPVQTISTFLCLAIAQG